MSDSSLLQVDDVSRRDALRRIALALTAVGARSLDLASAQQVHHAARSASPSGVYKAKFLNPHEYRTVARLAELIVPADERGGSAVDAGSPQFIDVLCSENEQLGRIYSGGLGWFDAWMRQHYDTSFIDATEQQQTEMLDAIVAVEEAGQESEVDSELGPGIRFFDWIRKMSVDAYYSSEIGIKDLRYQGNGAYSEYTVPKEALDFIKPLL
ncbi:MAG: gluconate 2-dehydrogenase subunit 3 family protein [Bryobacterales bacterium]|nr:gluconate 2-dehydrogenase subunit 3 family protein [Bryobacterales bacterium]